MMLGCVFKRVFDEQHFTLKLLCIYVCLSGLVVRVVQHPEQAYWNCWNQSWNCYKSRRENCRRAIWLFPLFEPLEHDSKAPRYCLHRLYCTPSVCPHEWATIVVVTAITAAVERIRLVVPIDSSRHSRLSAQFGSQICRRLQDCICCILQCRYLLEARRHTITTNTIGSWSPWMNRRSSEKIDSWHAIWWEEQTAISHKSKSFYDNRVLSLSIDFQQFNPRYCSYCALNFMNLETQHEYEHEHKDQTCNFVKCQHNQTL